MTILEDFLKSEKLYFNTDRSRQGGAKGLTPSRLFLFLLVTIINVLFEYFSHYQMRDAQGFHPQIKPVTIRRSSSSVKAAR